MIAENKCHRLQWQEMAEREWFWRTLKETRKQKLGNISSALLRETVFQHCSIRMWNRGAHHGTARRARGGTPGAWRRAPLPCWTPLDWALRSPHQESLEELFTSNRPAARPVALPQPSAPHLSTSLAAFELVYVASRRSAWRKATSDCWLRAHWRELTRCSKSHSMPREHCPGTTGIYGLHQPTNHHKAAAMAPLPKLQEWQAAQFSLSLHSPTFSLLISGTCVFANWLSKRVNIVSFFFTCLLLF